MLEFWAMASLSWRLFSFQLLKWILYHLGINQRLEKLEKLLSTTILPWKTWKKPFDSITFLLFAWLLSSFAIGKLGMVNQLDQHDLRVIENTIGISLYWTLINHPMIIQNF